MKYNSHNNNRIIGKSFFFGNICTFVEPEFIEIDPISSIDSDENIEVFC